MTKQEIEDYINTYRIYPDEYTGKKDRYILHLMNRGYKYDAIDNTISRLEGKINDNGDFELIGSFTFPVGKPEEKVPTKKEDPIKQAVITYNNIISDIGFTDRVAKDKWNLADLVAETEYVLSVLISDDYPLKKDNQLLYDRYTARLRDFLRSYRALVENMVPVDNHDTRYSKLRRIRKAKMLSIPQLAKLSGISEATIERYENDPTSLNKAFKSTLTKLCNALDYNIDDILD